MAQRPYTGPSSLDVRSLALIAVAATSLLLWLIPAALGRPMAFDWAIATIWILIIGLVLILFMRADRKKRELKHMVYIDEAEQWGFNPCIGTFTFRSSEDLVDKLIFLFAMVASNDDEGMHAEAPAGFVPTHVLETSEFRFRRDEGVKVSDPVTSYNDVTVDSWSGRIVDTKTGQQYPFGSLFELEEMV